MKRYFKWGVIILIIVSFTITGINSSFFSEDGDTVASVGKQKISFEQFRREYRNHLYYLQSLFNFQLGDDQLNQLNLAEMVLNHLVQEASLKELFREIKFNISDDVGIDAIKKQEAFMMDGKFQRERFLSFLDRMSFTESEYLEKIKFEVARDMFFSGFFQLSANYDKLTEKLYQNKYQRREVKIARVSNDLDVDVSDPTNKQLEEFYNANKDLFYTKEYRSAQYIYISPDNMNPGMIDISKNELEGEFLNLGLDKKLDVDYIIFEKEDDAEKALNSISGDFDFYKNDIKSFHDKNIMDFPDELHDLLKSSNSAWNVIPARDLFYLIRVNKTRILSDDEKDNKLTEVKHDLILKKLSTVIEEIEMEVASSDNVDFFAMSQKYGGKFQVVNFVDSNGVDTKGNDLQIMPTVLDLMFSQEVKDAKSFSAVGKNYINVYVTNVRKPVLQGLSDVRDDVASLLKQKHRESILMKKAEKMLVSNDFDDDLLLHRSDVAHEEGISQDLPNEFVEEIFTIGNGENTKVYKDKNDFIAGKLVRIDLPENDELKMSKLNYKIKQDIALSLISDLTEHCMKKFKVKINSKMGNDLQ